jgi:type II secretory pathway pseudopilin PulG
MFGPIESRIPAIVDPGSNANSRRPSFTIVELLVAITIIAVLVGLLLPAVQSARETARQAQCRDQLRQITLALFTYHVSHNKFPHGGWGHEWVGVPDRGTGTRQPGSWIYCVLPHLEERGLHGLGLGLVGSAATEAYSQRLQTPLCLFVCPSRRPCAAWPVADPYAYVRTPKPFGNVTVVARGDYAINGGSSDNINLGGPADLRQGDDPVYCRDATTPRRFSGISHLRLAVALRSVLDGTSKTYLVGEKHLVPDSYYNGTSSGDNESLYAGYCTDLHRFAGVIERIKLGLLPYVAPLNDHAVLDNGISSNFRFGSAHATGLNMAFCDGSMQFVSYDIDADVHFRAGHRADDGNPLASLK